jgi:hypothetical protein
MRENATTSLSCGSTSTILVSCALHRGPRVFAPLLVQARDGEIVLEAQVTGGSMIIFDEAGASVLFDLLGAWLTGAQVG